MMNAIDWAVCDFHDLLESLGLETKGFWLTSSQSRAFVKKYQC